MTAQADLIRSKRKRFAAPGGFHDRLVSFLAKALPAAIGLVAAVMILAPLGPRGEISFLLDRNKVAITGERVKVDDAMYRGQDSRGRPFRLTSGSAVQAASRDPVVKMTDLLANIELADGPASLRAPEGAYNYRSEQVTVAGPVRFEAADGYSLVTRNVSIDLRTRRAIGSGGISGTIPSGTFSASSIIADLENRTLTLQGNAHMRMIPGKLRLP